MSPPVSAMITSAMSLELPGMVTIRFRAPRKGAIITAIRSVRAPRRRRRERRASPRVLRRTRPESRQIRVGLPAAGAILGYAARQHRAWPAGLLRSRDRRKALRHPRTQAVLPGLRDSL